jgi:hypothetical protein
MAAANSIQRCAVCGIRHRKLIRFGLLAEFCRSRRIKLKVRTSDYFGLICIRKAYDQLDERTLADVAGIEKIEVR